ncbi:hypothetical protein [Ulvibacter litoralis]|uniref:Uncharacterized protein n=1 Tax=Ulvibacter litoralis TaxID=227084 RepID=A0A1G7CVF2_9FLAO|nr:hypothetical protein [Ulvibacter litoralis]GHC46166.1 hypothetical protein GCM10008083_06450 [Ulvibacter litoralis]SDE42475.1 hypothetical protein SAMN05421855_101551 [Ulvibacter litoralis]
MNTIEQILHIAKLKNNCPVCYATDGLEISFIQEEHENKYYNKIKKEVSETLYCHSCKNIIYPVNWNEDIERVYQYHKKQAKPKSAQIQLKPITYSVVIGILLVLFVVFYVASL